MLDPSPLIDPADQPTKAEMGELAVALLSEVALHDPALVARMVALGIELRPPRAAWPDRPALNFME